MSSTAGTISLVSETTGINYTINYEKIVFDLLPKRYRKIKLFKFILTSVYSLYSFWNNNFLVYRENSLREIRINSQTIVLEHYLNFFYNQTEIEILNTSFEISQTFIYKKDEIGDASNLNSYLYNQATTSGLSPQIYLYNRFEVQIEEDFTVRVPQSLLNTGVTQQQIKSLIDKYTVLGVTYKIVVFV
jgi:hypothetical protein